MIKREIEKLRKQLIAYIKEINRVAHIPLMSRLQIGMEVLIETCPVLVEKSRGCDQKKKRDKVNKRTLKKRNMWEIRS